MEALRLREESSTLSVVRQAAVARVAGGIPLDPREKAPICSAPATRDATAGAAHVRATPMRLRALGLIFRPHLGWGDASAMRIGEPGDGRTWWLEG